MKRVSLFSFFFDQATTAPSWPPRRAGRRRPSPPPRPARHRSSRFGRFRRVSFRAPSLFCANESTRPTHQSSSVAWRGRTDSAAAAVVVVAVAVVVANVVANGVLDGPAAADGARRRQEVRRTDAPFARRRRPGGCLADDIFGSNVSIDYRVFGVIFPSGDDELGYYSSSRLDDVSQQLGANNCRHGDGLDFCIFFSLLFYRVVCFGFRCNGRWFPLCVCVCVLRVAVVECTAVVLHPCAARRLSVDVCFHVRHLWVCESSRTSFVT